jgi:lipopolysaccharide transport system ATP-binding protein
MSDRDVVIRVEGISKLYRLGEVGTGSLAHDVNRWWHKVRGKEDPYLKIGEVNDRTKSVSSVERLESSPKTAKRNLTTEDTESTEVGAEVRLAGQAGGAFPNPSTSELAQDSENTSLIRSANSPHSSEEQSDSKALDSRPSTLVSAPKAQAPSDWVYALKDVSFEVKRGEVLGIIGRNGAGKSTLLKILSRVTTQSSGQIKVKGRIASLLEVGTGFHPELTGRENIFLNGAILGMRKAEIARKFDEIVEFSGCARYIDTPVKRYSSGMYVRLAFAVAAHLEPEILIVDEVLAVGDAEFQKKCLGKMKDVAGHGRTILFVSHNMTAVQALTNRCIVLQNGNISFVGSPSEAIRIYLDKNLESLSLDFSDKPRNNKAMGIHAKIQRIVIQGDSAEGLLMDSQVALKATISATKNFQNIRSGITIFDRNEQPIASGFSSEFDLIEGEDNIIRFVLPRQFLAPGLFSLAMSIFAGSKEAGRTNFDIVHNAGPLEIVPASSEKENLVKWHESYGSIMMPELSAIRCIHSK